jgi:hypothetical protein
MSVVGSLVGGILGSGAANSAANVQSQAAQKAQQLELQNQQAAQGSQASATAANVAAEQPYQQLGQTAAGGLNTLLSNGFQAPTLAQAEQTPGYQFQLQQGTNAINENAAANGTLMSGNTGKALQQYGQNLGQTAYQQTYQNALNSYMANYQSLMGGTGAGLSSTATMGQLGQAGAQNLANVDLTGGAQQAGQINNAAAARAAGIMGSANAWSNAAGGMASGLTSGLGNLDTTGSSSLGEQVGNFFGS